MKNLFSKHHPRSLTLARNLLGLLAVMALAGLLCAAKQCYNSNRITRSEDNRAKILGVTGEAAQDYDLLRLLSEGQIQVAREILNQKLSGNLLALDASLPSADQNTYAFVEGMFKLIARDYRQHPESYPLASISSTNYHDTNILNILKQAGLAAN